MTTPEASTPSGSPNSLDDPRLAERVIPAVMRVIDRGDFHGSVMRKVAKESRMSLNTLYSVVPSKSALMMAVALHVQGVVRDTVLAQLSPTDRPIDISRKALHANFEEFTQVPELTTALLTFEMDDESMLHVVAAGAEGLVSAPGLASPFDRSARSWTTGRLPVLTLGFVGTIMAYNRRLLTHGEAHAMLDHIVDAAYGLDP